ncbi:MAG TPA: hypothetical protein VHH54_02580 [Actinomycetota bacterium]|nr:hypothetical protein [Actinomycetota bacterium]
MNRPSIIRWSFFNNATASSVVLVLPLVRVVVFDRAAAVLALDLVLVRALLFARADVFFEPPVRLLAVDLRVLFLLVAAMLPLL